MYVFSLRSSNIVVISNYVLSQKSKILVIVKYGSVRLSKLQQLIFNLKNTPIIVTGVAFFFHKLFTDLFYFLLQLKNYNEFQNISSVKYNNDVAKRKRSLDHVPIGRLIYIKNKAN